MKPGGVYAVMNELNKKGLLHTDCMTVTGKTVGENIKDCVNLNPEVIRPIDNPYSQTGGLAVLKGNLAPDGGVCEAFCRCGGDDGTRRTGESLRTVKKDAIAAIKGGKIVEGDVVVIRYEGPKGGPGMREMLNPHIRHCRYGAGLLRRPDHRRTFQRRFQGSVHRTRFAGGSGGAVLSPLLKKAISSVSTSRI